MKFSKKCKIDKAAAKSDTRYATSSVKLEKNDDGTGLLIATDGRGLAAVNVTDTDDDDVGRLIPSDAIKAATKGKKGDDANLQANGAIRVYSSGNGYQEFSTDEFDHDAKRFPDYQSVLPKGDAVCTIAINPKLLADLAVAIGAGDGIILEIVEGSLDKSDVTGPIRIKPLDGTDSADLNNFGVIMPMGRF